MNKKREEELAKLKKRIAYRHAKPSPSKSEMSQVTTKSNATAIEKARFRDLLTPKRRYCSHTALSHPGLCARPRVALRAPRRPPPPPGPPCAPPRPPGGPGGGLRAITP